MDADSGGKKPRDYATARWFESAQLDFAARLRWSVTPKFSGANHPPQVSIDGSLAVTAFPGDTLPLKAAATDPEGDELTIDWQQYKDAGTYPGAVAFSDAESLATSVQISNDAKPGQTIHLILRVSDNGTPALTRFQRVIITVDNKN